MVLVLANVLQDIQEIFVKIASQEDMDQIVISVRA